MPDSVCLAPKCEETFRELQARRPQFQRGELPPEVLEFEPQTPVELHRKAFFDSLRSSPRGFSGPGPETPLGRHRFVRHRLQPDCARALAKQFMNALEEECAPFQFALSTRAGTDCVGHMFRAATDTNPSLMILSVNGIGACDHILRSAMLGRLHAMPEARSLLPFVRMSYGQPSTNQWPKGASAL